MQIDLAQGSGQWPVLCLELLDIPGAATGGLINFFFF